MPSKELPKATKLRDLVGKTITITDAPLKEIKGALGTSYIAQLDGGGSVFLSQTNLNNFEGGHQGTYKVRAYQSRFGNTSYALDNA